MNSSAANVVCCFQHELTAEQVLSIAQLEMACFTQSPRTLDVRIQTLLERGPDSEQANSKRFVVWDQSDAVAAARTFIRTMFVNEEPYQVLGLAGVCTAPSRRGQGLGKMVVRAALRAVDNGDCEFSLFRTGVPHFYEKLNCRMIANPIAHHPNENGWPVVGSEYIGLYPGDTPFPEGVVDLNGPLY